MPERTHPGTVRALRKPKGPISYLKSPYQAKWAQGWSSHKNVGVAIGLLGPFFHAIPIGLMLTFPEVGVAPATPAYTKPHS